MLLLSKNVTKMIFKNVVKSRVCGFVTNVTRKNRSFIFRLKNVNIHTLLFKICLYLGNSCNIVTFCKKASIYAGLSHFYFCNIFVTPLLHCYI